MENDYSERYKKALVTVAMGLRSEDDIQAKGVYRFVSKNKFEFVKLVQKMFAEGGNLLILKVKKIGFRSEHIQIKSQEELDNFLNNNIDDAFGVDNELWVLKTSTISCYRCRLYINSETYKDIFEVVYSNDDHALDHISNNTEQYARIFRTKDGRIDVENCTFNDEKLSDIKDILNDLYKNYGEQLNAVREDMQILNLSGISIDIRVNNGYDFHDFDVTYTRLKDVVEYYMNVLKKKKTDRSNLC